MMFGCPNGRPWMLSSSVPMSPKWRRHFLRLTREAVEMWNDRFPILSNFIDARNDTHIRWLKSLGFVFIYLHKRHGPLGMPFYEFVRIKPQRKV